MNTPRTTLYRDKQNGKVLGVCSGIADYTGVDVLWVRLATLALMITQGWPILVYIALGVFVGKKPAYLYSADPQENQYWQRVRQNPKRSAREIRGQMKDVDRRLAEVESYYVSSNPRLNAEIEQLR